jgi:hypothetical protein
LMWACALTMFLRSRLRGFLVPAFGFATLDYLSVC